MKAISFVAVGLLLVLALIPIQAHGGHGHSHEDHGHSHDEDPSYRWSRVANEPRVEDEIIEDDILEDDIVDVPPGYSKEKPRHQHGGHGHSHGGHGHSHGGHGHSHGPPQREPTKEEREKHRERLHKIWDDDDDDTANGFSARTQLWISALSSVLAISLAPFAILFFFTLDNSGETQGVLKILLSFASGGLLGDAFLHLIPHAIMAQEGGDGHGHSHGGHGHSHGGHGHSHGEEEGHSHDLTVGLGVLAGILAFLVIEKVVRIYSEGGHGHSHGPVLDVPEKKDQKNKKNAKQSDNEEEDVKESETKVKAKKGKEKEKEEEKTPEQPEVKVAGYLNLFADFFHNFTDGLAIGASFLTGQSIGWSTTFMILFHEIPHEIGDYAILIQSGVSPFKAKCLQLLTAVGAIAGCIVSLLAEGAGDAVTAYILPFTAGGFIYIATVSVIPELLERTTLKQSLGEIAALLFGVGMMILIAQYE